MRIEKEWKNDNNFFRILWKEGRWTQLVRKYLGKGIDKLYLVEADKFPITHEQQLFLIEKKLKNDAKPTAFWKNWNDYNNLLQEIKKWREKIDENKN